MSAGSGQRLVSVTLIMLLVMATVHSAVDVVILYRIFAVGNVPLNDTLPVVDRVFVGTIFVASQLLFAFRIFVQRFQAATRSSAWWWHVLIWAAISVLALAGAVACLYGTGLLVKDANQSAYTLFGTVWLACSVAVNLLLLFSTCIVFDLQKASATKTTRQRLSQLIHAALRSGLVLFCLSLSDLIVFEAGTGVDDHLLVQRPLAVVYVIAVASLLTRNHAASLPSDVQAQPPQMPDLPPFIRRTWSSHSHFGASKFSPSKVSPSILPSLIDSRPMSVTGEALTTENTVEQTCAVPMPIVLRDQAEADAYETRAIMSRMANMNEPVQANTYEIRAMLSRMGNPNEHVQGDTLDSGGAFGQHLVHSHGYSEAEPSFDSRGPPARPKTREELEAETFDSRGALAQPKTRDEIDAETCDSRGTIRRLGGRLFGTGRNPKPPPVAAARVRAYPLGGQRFSSWSDSASNS